MRTSLFTSVFTSCFLLLAAAFAEEGRLVEISAGNFREIRWQPVEPHPGLPRYRMAAADDGAGMSKGQEVSSGFLRFKPGKGQACW